MLLTSVVWRLAATLVTTAAVLRPNPAAAQSAAAGRAAVTPQAAGNSITPERPARPAPPVGPVATPSALGRARPRVVMPALSAPGLASQAQAPADQRGRYALVGLLVGAAAGWGWFAWHCSHGADCYSPVGGLLLAAAGGALGAFVGLLLAPMPPPG